MLFSFSLSRPSQPPPPIFSTTTTLRAAKAKTKPQRIIPSGGVASTTPPPPPKSTPTTTHTMKISHSTPVLLNPIDGPPTKLPTMTTNILGTLPLQFSHNSNGSNSGGGSGGVGVAKKTTKNHPRIKYSVKQPHVAGQPLTTSAAHSMASLVSSISAVPLAVSNHNQKSELLNFTLSRKFGHKLSTTSLYDPTNFTATFDHSKGTGNVFTASGTTVAIMKDEAQPPPVIQQIYIQQPIETKTETTRITNEELQSSIISELSNYAIDEIELNPYPESAHDSIDRGGDSQSGTMYRMDSGDIKGEDSNEMKYSEMGIDDANKNYECRHCGKKYRWKSTLRRHENVECGGKEPAYQCPHCTYKAKQRGNLGVHIRKHHGELPQLESRRKMNRTM